MSARLHSNTLSHSRVDESSNDDKTLITAVTWQMTQVCRIQLPLCNFAHRSHLLYPPTLICMAGSVSQLMQPASATQEAARISQ